MSKDIEGEIKRIAPHLALQIKQAASARNEAEFRTKIAHLIEDIAGKLKIPIYPREEYTLLEGRADAVYNRLVLEYKAPGVLKKSNSYKSNQDAIEKVKDYIRGLVRRERHKPERLAGAILDGNYFIFLRTKEGVWHIDSPLKVDDYSTEYFLKLLTSLSKELALIPDNLVRDFGENTLVSRKAVGALYKALTETQNSKVKKLFEQWSLQFGEVCDYERASKLKVDSFARRFGITSKDIKPFYFFFCLHTYYATFIKLLAVQVVHYYAMPRLGTDIRQAATFGSQQLRAYFEKMEEGGIFRELGIANLLEGDFFSWYLDVWDEPIYQAAREIVSTLANYSLITLDVDPDSTRDLLKKLYQQLMPGELRHNLGEYYTPDWLAERLLNMLEGGKFKGDPNKRLIDPACGSGTFLVIAIKKIREYAAERMLPESQVLDKILSNIVGFDLNPLAVISARTNYLLALGDLLQHRKENVDIPVYMCDSIMTPQEGRDLFSRGVLRFNTAVGPFSLPKSLIQAQYIDKLSNLLEESVKLELNKEQFIKRLCQELPLIPEQDNRDIEVVSNLYESLLTLQRQGVNGIWARIIKNSFAPLFAGEFDYVAGNPPWVNWESLPENYRDDTKPLWEEHGLFPHGGMDTILGKGKKDISMLMSYVAMDKYLKKGGKLGFLITQSVFKTAGAGQGFRRFLLGNGEYVQVQHVDDMVELQPFEGASNRTSVVILQKGRQTKYPMPSYLYWKKTAKGKSIAIDSSLDDVLQMTERKQFAAEPVDGKDPTSAWLTGKPKAIKAVKKILGQSDYIAHEGVNTGGANGVYWVDIIDKRPDGLVVVSNITEGAKRKVESIQMAIEPDLLYPLLRGRDVKRWHAEPSVYILMVQDVDKRQGIDEDEMKTDYPKTYLYLKRFEAALRERAAYRRYFRSDDPFYSMFDVGDYTFAPYKVVWTRIGTVEAAVVNALDGKSIIPQETITLVACDKKEKAHYIASLVNSSIFQYAVTSYSQAGGKSMGSMHVLENIRIPKFDPTSKVHQELAGLSQNAHYAVAIDDEGGLRELEERIDELAAQMWGLTTEELAEIKSSLQDLA
ncbi:SAM-dependent methyltransferase [Dehalococcoidales bacterium]|nr:SAM-dependent methyltransferase [Dehalococcoidales bacterium]